MSFAYLGENPYQDAADQNPHCRQCLNGTVTFFHRLGARDGGPACRNSQPGYDNQWDWEYANTTPAHTQPEPQFQETTYSRAHGHHRVPIALHWAR